MAFVPSEQCIVLLPKAEFCISQIGLIRIRGSNIHALELVGETTENYVAVCSKAFMSDFIYLKGCINDYVHRRTDLDGVEEIGNGLIGKKLISEILRTQSFVYSQHALVIVDPEKNRDQGTIAGRLEGSLETERVALDIRINPPSVCRTLRDNSQFEGCLHHYNPIFMRFYSEFVDTRESTVYCCGQDSRRRYFTNLQDNRYKITYNPSLYIEFATKDPLRVELEQQGHVYTKYVGCKSVTINCPSVTSVLSADIIGFRSGTSEELAVGICFANPSIAIKILGSDVVAQPQYKHFDVFVSPEEISHIDENIVHFIDDTKRPLPRETVFIMNRAQARRLREFVEKYTLDWATSGPSGTIMHYLIESLHRGEGTIESRLKARNYFNAGRGDGTHDMAAFIKSIEQPSDFDTSRARVLLRSIVDKGNALFSSYARHVHKHIQSFSGHVIPEIVLSLAHNGECAPMRNVDDIDRDTYLVGSTDGIIIPRDSGSFFLVDEENHEFIDLDCVVWIRKLQDSHNDTIDFDEFDEPTRSDDFEDEESDILMVVVGTVDGKRTIALRITGCVLVDWKSIKDVKSIDKMNNLLTSTRMPESWRVPSKDGIVNVLPPDFEDGVPYEIRAVKEDKYVAQVSLYITAIKQKHRFRHLTALIVVIDVNQARVYVAKPGLVSAWERFFIKHKFIKIQ